MCLVQVDIVGAEPAVSKVLIPASSADRVQASAWSWSSWEPWVIQLP
ncbi:hypothetical protein [Kribbella caucasensis]